MPDYSQYGKVRKSRQEVMAKRAAAAEHELHERRKALARKTTSAKYYKDKNQLHEKIATAALQMLRQFIDEIAGKPLLGVDYGDKDSVIRRKDQLTIMKETMAMLKMLRDLYRQLAEEYKLKDEDINMIDDGNVVLFEQAKALLKERGVNIPPDVPAPVGK